MVGDRNGCYLLRLRSISIPPRAPPPAPVSVSRARITPAFLFAADASPSRALSFSFPRRPSFLDGTTRVLPALKELFFPSVSRVFCRDASRAHNRRYTVSRKIHREL